MSQHQATRGTRRRRVLTLSAACVLAAGALTIGAISFAAPPDTPPTYAGDRPEPASSGYIAHTESVFIAVPPKQFNSWVNAPGRELGDIVDASEGLPPVVGTQPLRGDWNPAEDRTGDRRRVQFADGHYLAEEVLVDTPERFRYMIWGFTSYQRLAVRHAVAEFTYVERDAGTQLSWTYSFLPSTGIIRPLVSSFVERTIAPMMRGTLEGMRTGSERDLAA